MDIIRITPSTFHRSIPLNGLDCVEQVLNLHAFGTPYRHNLRMVSRADLSGQVKLMNQGITDRVFPMIQGSPPSIFVQRFMMEIRAQLLHHDSHSMVFDHSVQGAFAQTYVNVQVLDRDANVYGLSITTVLGDKAEKDLADCLRIQRCLLWTSLTVATHPVDGTCFEFDFEEVLRKLDVLLLTGWISGVELAEYIFKGDPYEGAPPFVLRQDADLEVSICMSDVGARIQSGPGWETDDMWSRQGALLRGNLRNFLNDPFAFHVPTFRITITRTKERASKQRKPIWDTRLQRRAIQLRDQIAEALTST